MLQMKPIHPTRQKQVGISKNHSVCLKQRT